MTKTDLKWRFTAFYNDDDRLVQPLDDIGSDGLHSSYSDVKHDKLVIFTLSNNSNFFSLNLRTGEFNTNAGRFKLHVGELRDIKLHYFRRVTAQLGATDVVSYYTQYHLGFTAINEQGATVTHGVLLQ